MSRRSAPTVAAILVLLGCRGPAPSAARTDVGGTASRETPPPQASGEDEARLPDGHCHPAALVPTGEGGLLLDACFDPPFVRTDVLAQRLDRTGAAVGPRLRLARVEGTVLSLAATTHGERLEVAWLAHRGAGAAQSDDRSDVGGGDRELSLLSVATNLQGPHAVIAVARHPSPRLAESARGWPRAHAEVAVLADGTRVVLATDAEERCPQGAQSCASWSLFAVSPTGAVRRLHHDSTATPAVEPHALRVVGDDVLYLRGSDAARSVTYVHVVVPGGGPASLPAPASEPLIDWSSGTLVATNAALVALGEERSLDAAEARTVVRVTPCRGHGGTHPRAAEDLEAVRWPVVTSRTWRCVHQRPLMRVQWRGGSIDLDLTAGSDTLDLGAVVPPALSGLAERHDAPGWTPPMAWVGEALVALDGHDSLQRWRCAREGAALERVPGD